MAFHEIQSRRTCVLSEIVELLIPPVVDELSRSALNQVILDLFER